MRVASLLTLVLFASIGAAQEPEPVLLPEPPSKQWPPLYLPPDEPGARQNLTQLPGWYVDVEIALLFPDIRFRSRGDEGSDRAFGQGSRFGYDTDVATTFGIGYQFGNGTSSFLMSYRFFGAEGRPDFDQMQFNDLISEYRTRIDVNEFNWLFRQQLLLPLPRTKITLEAGARLASVYFDVCNHTEYTADFLAAADLARYTSDFQVSSQFIGAGPTVGFTNEFEVGDSLTLFAHSDFAALFGRNTMRFRSVASTPGYADYTTDDSQRQNTTAKVLKASAGLNWAPARTPHMSFSGGYQFEYWWDINNQDGLSTDFLTHGIFARVKLAW